jgi:hypothetical protein
MVCPLDSHYCQLLCLTWHSNKFWVKSFYAGIEVPLAFVNFKTEIDTAPNPAGSFPTLMKTRSESHGWFLPLCSPLIQWPYLLSFVMTKILVKSLTLRGQYLFRILVILGNLNLCLQGILCFGSKQAISSLQNCHVLFY